VNKKILIGILVILITSTASFFLFRPKNNQAVIAVVTTLSHPALVLARDGFVKKIKELHADYEIKDFNAEGSMQSANLIARHIAQDTNIKAIFALGSLAAQTVGKVETKRPLVIAAVSDPNSILKQSSNICGLSDLINADYQISTILDLLPDTKTISVLYSPHETNSSGASERLKASIEKNNIKANLIGIYEPQQISTASAQACSTSDVIIIPLDNQLAASMSVVIKATKNLSCIVILSDKVLLHQGAAFAFGVDYYENGEESALMMDKILTHEKTCEQLGIKYPEELDIYANTKIINQKNIQINKHKKTKIINFDGDN
jgi:putative ABC transport system substrate-binding protein